MTQQPKPRSFYEKAATASVLAVPLLFIMGLVFNGMKLDSESQQMFGLVRSVVVFLIMGTGIVAGLVALSGIRHYGKQGILAKALLGVLAPLILVLLAVPALQSADSKRAVILAPPMASPDNVASLDKEMTDMVGAINRRGPQKIDEDTQLNGAEVSGERTITFTYSVLTKTKDEIPKEVLTGAIQSNLNTAYQTSPNFEFFRNKGLTVTYKYLDRSGALIGEVSAGPAPR